MYPRYQDIQFVRWRKTKVNIKLQPLNHNVPKGLAPKNITGELLAPVSCHQPVRTRQNDGTIIETAPVLHHGTGWCSTADGTYIIDLTARESTSARGNRELEDCDLTWRNEHHLLADLFRAQSRGLIFDGGVLRQKLGIAEVISEHFATQLVAVEEEVRALHACPAHQACAVVRAMLSTLAYDWHSGLLHTNAADELVIIHHETDLFSSEGKRRLRFLSVRHQGTLTYCHTDEIHAVDSDLGQNMRRLRSLIERWDDIP